MSPEQARGNPGDFRTDQFSFGALCTKWPPATYAFRRDSVADTLAAVLHEEPQADRRSQSTDPGAAAMGNRALPGQGRERTILGYRRSGS